MPYATNRRYCDADSHTVETLGWVERYADPAVRDRLAPFDLSTRNAKATYDFISAATDMQKARAARGENPAEVIRGPKGWHAPGAFDPAERSAALDDLGFARQLVFSTYAGVQYLWHPELEVRYGGCRAHNRAAAAFCGHDKRLVAVGQVTLDDPARAVEELKEGVRLGCGAFWIPALPAAGRSPGHPDLEPVWRTFCELRVPFMLHVGPNSRIALQGYENNGKRPPKPEGHEADGGEAINAREFMVLAVAPQQFLSALVFDGVFERFPDLRGGVIELGAGWAPEYLRTLDLCQKVFGRRDPKTRLPMRASEYVRRAVKFTPFAGEDVGRMIRDGGADLFLFSSDYPHPEGTDDPIGRFERTMDGIDEASKEKFYSANFQSMMSEPAL